MKRKVILMLIGRTLSLSALVAQPTAERYVVSFLEGMHVNHVGAFANALPNSLPVGIGSDLLFTDKQGDALTFATTIDHDPNTDSPKEGKNETKIFIAPDFASLLMTVRVQNGKAEAIDPCPLHGDRDTINGPPLASDVTGSTNEVAFSDTLHRLKGDSRGLGTEGITPDDKGGYQLCDEYGPFLTNINSKGKIWTIHSLQAAEGEKAIAGDLPNIFKWRRASRGFEGLTRMSGGRVIVVVQSMLSIDAKSKEKALLTRLTSFDPTDGKTAMYGYPTDSVAYSKNSDAKIGGIVALDNRHTLLVEQGKGKNNRMRNLIYEVDFNKVNDLSGFDKPSEYPESNDEKTLSQRGITFARKTQAVDLRSLGWQQERVKGLALIDSKTLAVVNDNDFGVEVVMQHPVEGKTLKDCRVNTEGKLTLDDKQVETTLRVKSLEKPESDNELRITTLPEVLR